MGGNSDVSSIIIYSTGLNTGLYFIQTAGWKDFLDTTDYTLT